MSEGKHVGPETARAASPAGSSPTEGERGIWTGATGNTRQSGRSDPNGQTSGRGKRILKWAALIIGLIFFAAIMREAMDPFGDKPYIEISHGDHVHYVPQDRDPNVPMGRFPTSEPAPDERITPDGRIVKKDRGGSNAQPLPRDDQRLIPEDQPLEDQPRRSEDPLLQDPSPQRED